MKRRSYYLFHCIHIENTSMLDSIKGVPFVFIHNMHNHLRRRNLKHVGLLQPQPKISMLTSVMIYSFRASQ